MFNSYSCSQNQSMSINAVTGAILKNHPKSWFERFHLKSARAEKLLVEGGHKSTEEKYHIGDNSWSRGYYTTERAPEKDITVLQMVICGDMEVMAELVYTKDYEVQVSRGERE